MADQDVAASVRAAKRGDKQAFEQLIRRFQGKVYRAAYAMLGDHMEAEDVAQEAFVKAYLSLDKLDSEYAFASWLGRMTHHLCVDRIRLLSRKASPAEPEWLNVVPSPDSTDRTEWRLAIEEAVRRLPIEQREVIALREVQGYRYDEMAEILGIPQGTVKSRLNAARSALRQQLDPTDGGERQ